MTVQHEDKSSVRGALDVGSNTVRLLVATVENGVVEPTFDHASYARLGAQVDATGRLQDDRMEAAIDAIQHYASLARALHVSSLPAAATSAVRDATNGAEFLDRVEEETGVHIEILTGEREAELTFRGATAGHTSSEPEIVVDLGGGSMEIVRGRDGKPDFARSIRVGARRLTERHVRHDPPTSDEMKEVQDAVATELPPEVVATPSIALFFTGGTAANAAHIGGLKGPPFSVDVETLQRILDIVCGDNAEGLATQYGVDIERARVLPAGVAALQSVVREFRPSQAWIGLAGLREGMILEHA